MNDETNSMNITLLYFPDCPHWQTAHERLTELIAEGHDATASCVIIDTDDARSSGRVLRLTDHPDRRHRPLRRLGRPHRIVVSSLPDAHRLHRISHARTAP